ncbi:MAG: ATP-dependent Clp protease proteolytic subunit [Planctomycetes bacterium]|nr:ATP-dependent Clp protease proteolytic subunit [Planctomycetota bacterium]
MAEAPPSSIDAITRTALTEALKNIEKHRDADVLAIFGPLYASVENRVRQALEMLDGPPSRRKRLIIILDTPGGSIDTAERIVQVTRHFYPDHVAFLVPDRAMSAGTILAMSGDEIWMDYYSCLGPIDPQVERRADDGSRFVPALGYLDQYERLQAAAAKGRMTQADAILLSKLDLAELRRFELERDRSIELIKDWLSRYKFKNWSTTRTTRKKVTKLMRSNRAAQIAKDLQSLKRWGSHSRGITMEVLTNDLNLVIDDYSQIPGLPELVRTYIGLMRQVVPPQNSFVHSRMFF